MVTYLTINGMFKDCKAKLITGTVLLPSVYCDIVIFYNIYSYIAG